MISVLVARLPGTLSSGLISDAARLPLPGTEPGDWLPHWLITALGASSRYWGRSIGVITSVMESSVSLVWMLALCLKLKKSLPLTASVLACREAKVMCVGVMESRDFDLNVEVCVCV